MLLLTIVSLLFLLFSTLNPKLTFHRNPSYHRSYNSLKVSVDVTTVTMAVSVAVCDIFSVKEWPDLENRVRVHSRSLEMAPFDRSPTSLNT